MATTTVKALAEELKRSSADLLVQLKAAGIDKESEADKITDKDKTALLAYLQKAHGSAETGTRKKITLTKRETSEIRQADSAGRTRTVQVEVRKKRVLVKRDDAAKADEPTEVKPAPVVETKPILSDEELEKRAAEAARQAELLARQEAEMKAASEA
ncbi:MAG: Translation initiation factor, partial [Pseudomonadota bacterium]